MLISETLFSKENLEAIWLSLRLATTVTVLLLALSTPLAWWLARSHSSFRRIVASLVSLPLVLPPTVLGFYLLILLGRNGVAGRITQELGLGIFPFTFTGLVIGSLVYSLPFAVQPLQNAFEAMGKRPMEAAATLGASFADSFFTVALPLARPGFLTAAVLTFAHTVGEFGVVLMLGGNIAGKTTVISVQIYNLVEASEYVQAHWLAGAMMLFSFLVLLLVYGKKAGDIHV